MDYLLLAENINELFRCSESVQVSTFCGLRVDISKTNPFVFTKLENTDTNKKYLWLVISKEEYTNLNIQEPTKGKNFLFNVTESKDKSDTVPASLI